MACPICGYVRGVYYHFAQRYPNDDLMSAYNSFHKHLCCCKNKKCPLYMTLFVVKRMDWFKEKKMVLGDYGIDMDKLRTIYNL